MIRRLKYNEIDFPRYQKVLLEACQLSDFAKKDFMNVVANENWGLLVYKDYEAVMPIAWSNNFGVKIIQMPALCHQLGVFSQKDDADVNLVFLEFLEKNFAVAYYAFNKDNGFPMDTQRKTSYIIPQNNYEEVKKNYHIHRRRNVRHTEEVVANIEFRDNADLDKHVEAFFLENVKGVEKASLKKMYWGTIKKLIKAGLLETFIVNYKGELQSFMAVYHAGEVDYLSTFINSSQLENKNIPSIAIDHKLQQSIKDKGFDFMGSDVSSVASFNERFGAQQYTFTIIRHPKQNIIKKIIGLAFGK